MNVLCKVITANKIVSIPLDHLVVAVEQDLYWILIILLVIVRNIISNKIFLVCDMLQLQMYAQQTITVVSCVVLLVEWKFVAVSEDFS